MKRLYIFALAAVLLLCLCACQNETSIFAKEFTFPENTTLLGVDISDQTKDEAWNKLEAAAAEGKEKGVKGLPTALGIEMAAEMIAKIKDEKLCDGVHIMAIGAEKNVPSILDKAGITIA